MDVRTVRRKRLEQLLELAQAYQGCSRKELARILGRDRTKLVPTSGGPKLDMVIDLCRVLEWPVGDVAGFLWPGSALPKQTTEVVSIDDVDVDVDFEVRVPSGVLFTGRTVSGNVEVEDLDSFVLARTVSGDIYVSTSDLADAVTVSGSIDVAMGRADWRGDLEFHTVSGDITISFPESLNTEIEFETLSGDMDSDFPITMTSRRNQLIGGRISGTIGEGGRSLSLKTVSGDVRLRRGR